MIPCLICFLRGNPGSPGLCKEELTIEASFDSTEPIAKVSILSARLGAILPILQPLSNTFTSLTKSGWNHQVLWLLVGPRHFCKFKKKKRKAEAIIVRCLADVTDSKLVPFETRRTWSIKPTIIT